MRVRRAFTLIEVLVALALTGLVAVGVRDLYEMLNQAETRVTRETEILDSDANARRFLTSLAGSVDMTGAGFVGDSASVQFTSWCMTSNGWLERREVILRISEDDSRLLVVGPSGDTVHVLGAGKLLQFRYLVPLESEVIWSPTWFSPISAPQAIGLVSPRDTIILRIGDRG